MIVNIDTCILDFSQFAIFKGEGYFKKMLNILFIYTWWCVFVHKYLNI